jgi:hypothetical protein
MVLSRHPLNSLYMVCPLLGLLRRLLGVGLQLQVALLYLVLLLSVLVHLSAILRLITLWVTHMTRLAFP